MRKSPWLAYVRPRPHARLRLFCFAHAGAGASAYRNWGTRLPAAVDLCPVQLPGRETRLGEPAFATMESLVPALADALEPYQDLPAAYFGHSLGCLVAFELCREYRRRALSLPVHLFASGCRPPQVEWPAKDREQLGDRELAAYLRDLGGTPEEVLRDQEFMSWYLPTLRADFRVFDRYAYRAEPPLALSISALAGAQDVEATPEVMRRWVEQTRGLFALHAFPGGHMFLHTDDAPVLAVVARVLGQLLGPFGI